MDFNITEELLALCPMKDTCTGEDIFHECNAALQKANLNYTKLVSMTTDGAPAMLGTKKGLQGHTMDELSRQGLPHDLIWCHCIIHQENLCSKTLGFKDVMSKVIDNVNYIRAHALNHRQFKELLQELDANYGDVLYFSAVRWLSRGRTLKRFFELKDELAMFLGMKGQPVGHFSDSQWLDDLAFLVDITEKLNALNVSMQGRGKLVHNLYGCIQSFENKLELWESQLRAGRLDHFTALQGQHGEDETVFDGERYATEVARLKKEFEKRFQDFCKHKVSFEIFAMPFSFDPLQAPTDLQEELIELKSDIDIKAQFLEKELQEFYRGLPRQTFPNLIKHAQKLFSMFGSTYLCEQFFSKLKYSKNKNRNALSDMHLEDTLRVASSHLVPDINSILGEQKQYQVSH